ncbi:hypothetical protein ACFC0P_41295, partial [Streptomyces broussonetiae]
HDSPSNHAFNPNLDAKRLIVGCPREHLAELVEQDKQRPFVDAELWAGKIYRASEAHGGRISPEELAYETGLAEGQIRLGVLWQNLGAQGWHRWFGKGDGPESAG